MCRNGPTDNGPHGSLSCAVVVQDLVQDPGPAERPQVIEAKDVGDAVVEEFLTEPNKNAESSVAAKVDDGDGGQHHVLGWRSGDNHCNKGVAGVEFALMNCVGSSTNLSVGWQKKCPLFAQASHV